MKWSMNNNKQQMRKEKRLYFFAIFGVDGGSLRVHRDWISLFSSSNSLKMKQKKNTYQLTKAKQ